MTRQSLPWTTCLLLQHMVRKFYIEAELVLVLGELGPAELGKHFLV